MVSSDIERYVELVDTLDLPIEATSTYAKWQEALAEELGMRYSDLVATRTWEGVEVFYEFLPEVGVQYRRVEMKWGFQGQFISVDPALSGVPGGRFMSFEQVSELIGGL